MTVDLWIWISRWDEFQHYKPERDRGPAWIKDYTKQMLDSRYLQLTDRQRALLRDMRDVFAMTAGRLPDDHAVIARHRHRQTRDADLKALNHAGFIESVSRETLENRLEKLYASRAPARSSEVEVEEEKDQEPSFSPTEARTDEAQEHEPKNGWTEMSLDDIDFQNIVKDVPA